jgi:hypothetical protein
MPRRSQPSGWSGNSSAGGLLGLDRYSDQEIEAVCKELDEAEQQGAIPLRQAQEAEPQTIP